MRSLKPSLPIFTLAMVIMAAMTGMLFGSAPQHVHAQDGIPTITPTSEVQAQIIGGEVADAGEWPWQVALINSSAGIPYYGQFCGGSLIHPLWVLTAAHCVTEGNGTISPVSSIDVVAGMYDLYYQSSGFQRQNVSQIIRHPSYIDNNTFNNDLALIKLENPITIGGSGWTKTAIIPLVPATIGSLAGEEAWVTGWGNISADDPPAWPTSLWEVELPIMSNSTCSDYNHWGYGITANMLCAGFDAGTKSSCQGDSGGPLVVSYAGDWHLAGIVSFGPEGCAVPYLPSVYTRVSRYVSWVNSHADLINPGVSGIVRTDSNPTILANVHFTVTFSESVTGVDLSNFVLTTTGVSGAAINEVSGLGSIYTVTVATGGGDGTIRLDVVDDDTIRDASFNLLGGKGAGNGNFTSGQSYTIDRTPPAILSILRMKATPNALSHVSYMVTFSESVTGVDVEDFILTIIDLSGASIGSITGSGATRVVIVNTGSGDGTIRLDAVDNDTIVDLASNPLNGVFNSGQAYTIDKPALPAPDLRSPRNNAVTNNTKPTFWWTAVKGGATYEIQFASDNAFTSNVDNEIVNGTSHTVITPFVGGSHFWRVRARNVINQPGAWSSTRTFTIDITGPSAPLLSFPATSSSSNQTPTFKWLNAPTAVLYEFQYDDNSNCLSPIYAVTTRSIFRKPPAMKVGTYYWCVRAKDKAGNWGLWSAPFTITIIRP